MSVELVGKARCSERAERVEEVMREGDNSLVGEWKDPRPLVAEWICRGRV